MVKERDLVIIDLVNKVRMEIQKAVEERLIQLEKDILNEMGIPLEEARKELEARKEAMT